MGKILDLILVLCCLPALTCISKPCLFVVKFEECYLPEYFTGHIDLWHVWSTEREKEWKLFGKSSTMETVLTLPVSRGKAFR